MASLAAPKAAAPTTTTKTSTRFRHMRAAAVVSALAIAGLAAGAVHAEHHGKKDGHTIKQATAEFIDKESKPVGTATLTESPHGVLISLDLHGLPPETKA